MKIWIVEKYEIEGHYNLAVCTSLEKAKDFLDKCPIDRRYESYCVYEYETDVWCNNPNSSYDNPSSEPEIIPAEVA
jgi:hypothetical protein